MHLAKVGWHKRGNFLPEHFGNAIPEDAFCRGIREQDDAPFVDGDDGVCGCFRDYAEKLIGFRTEGRGGSARLGFPWDAWRIRHDTNTAPISSTYVKEVSILYSS